MPTNTLIDPNELVIANAIKSPIGKFERFGNKKQSSFLLRKGKVSQNKHLRMIGQGKIGCKPMGRK